MSATLPTCKASAVPPSVCVAVRGTVQEPSVVWEQHSCGAFFSPPQHIYGPHFVDSKQTQEEARAEVVPTHKSHLVRHTVYVMVTVLDSCLPSSVN